MAARCHESSTEPQTERPRCVQTTWNGRGGQPDYHPYCWWSALMEYDPSALVSLGYDVPISKLQADLFGSQ